MTGSESICSLCSRVSIVHPSAVPPGYGRSKRPARPKLDPYIGIIDRILVQVIVSEDAIDAELIGPRSPGSGQMQ